MVTWARAFAAMKHANAENQNLAVLDFISSSDTHRQRLILFNVADLIMIPQVIYPNLGQLCTHLGHLMFLLQRG